VSTQNSTGLRTLLVGVDGACLPVVEPLVADGQLPVLGDLVDSGAAGPLESQIPPWTPSAWPSLYTGTNPGKHGVFDFLAFDGYDWDVVNRTHVRQRALWELLAEQGLTSVVVNVPVTSPPTAFDGALVPGYVAPESPPTHPEGLLEDLRAELGDYRVYAPDDVEDGSDEQVAWYERLTEMRGAAFRHLADRFDPEFGFLQFQQTDTVFHERPGDDDAVRAVYEAVDDEVGAVLDACDPDTVILASDHGIGPYAPDEFRVNEYLREAGYVETTRGDGGMPSWTSLHRDERARDGDDDGRENGSGRPLSAWLVARAAAVGLTSQRIGRVLSALGLADLALRVVSTETVRAGTERVDFAESTAYMRSRTELGVRINLEGREPEGTVAQEDYDDVRADLIAALRGARTPDGDPVFSAVEPRETYFDGEHVEDAADVVVVPDGFDTYLTASLRGDAFGPTSESWNHKRDGLFAAVGDGVDTDAQLGDAHLFDVAPTVLSALGVPPSDAMDGEPLPVVDAVPPASYDDYEDEPARSTDDRAVERRLADLGYLDDP
jgi:predicted AlkP superfamily phosphohydrolase/phosphomutase